MTANRRTVYSNTDLPLAILIKKHPLILFMPASLRSHFFIFYSIHLHELLLYIFLLENKLRRNICSFSGERYRRAISIKIISSTIENSIVLEIHIYSLRTLDTMAKHREMFLLWGIAASGKLLYVSRRKVRDGINTGWQNFIFLRTRYGKEEYHELIYYYYLRATRARETSNTFSIRIFILTIAFTQSGFERISTLH